MDIMRKNFPVFKTLRFIYNNCTYPTINIFLEHVVNDLNNLDARDLSSNDHIQLNIGLTYNERLAPLTISRRNLSVDIINEFIVSKIQSNEIYKLNDLVIECLIVSYIIGHGPDDIANLKLPRYFLKSTSSYTSCFIIIKARVVLDLIKYMKRGWR